MGKDVTKLASAGLRLTNDYGNWRPSQPWLAERSRMVASCLYAQAAARDTSKGDTAPAAVHKTAISSQVSKAFGALFNESAPYCSVPWIVDLLVELQDLGDIGYGYHIPRESRMVRLAPGWGRIAGGLPLESSEHPDGGILCLLGSTLGRLAKLHENFVKYDAGTEHSEVYNWQTNTTEQIHAKLWSNLPNRTVTAPPEETTEFYNAKLKRARTRGDRWHHKMPIEPLVVARTRTLPSHYYLMAAKSDHGSHDWYELDKQEARRWLLLLEKSAGTTNTIRADRTGSATTLFLPDMLPGAWTAALLAAAFTVRPAEGGWVVEFQSESLELVQIIIRTANIQLL